MKLTKMKLTSNFRDVMGFLLCSMKYKINGAIQDSRKDIADPEFLNINNEQLLTILETMLYNQSK
jgi:hypothetical protein